MTDEGLGTLREGKHVSSGTNETAVAGDATRLDSAKEGSPE